MVALTLEKYLDLKTLTKAEFAKSIGRGRQNIANWIRDGATVEFTKIGIKIRTEKVVHESQVAK